MKNTLLNKPVLLNVIILIISGYISFIFLTIGVAHLIGGIIQKIEGASPDIPKGEAILGGIVVVLLCIIGFVSLLLTIAAIQAIIKRIKRNDLQFFCFRRYIFSKKVFL
ncbi:hypothetical protein KO566_08380 [Flavobacteriaceae bacterium XHP0103]|uniref:hypothetical protein n=1 Tax=Marixanthotalea marina TaxID=2844359 RepID=UPI002989D8C7|nr:hypothetical protein [Marixanthotalea marina]MBU3822073.1 hypothetical protein [Marixanthotalea marina]